MATVFLPVKGTQIVLKGHALEERLAFKIVLAMTTVREENVCLRKKVDIAFLSVLVTMIVVARHAFMGSVFLIAQVSTKHVALVLSVMRRRTHVFLIVRTLPFVTWNSLATMTVSAFQVAMEKANSVPRVGSVMNTGNVNS